MRLFIFNLYKYFFSSGVRHAFTFYVFLFFFFIISWYHNYEKIKIKESDSIATKRERPEPNLYLDRTPNFDVASMKLPERTNIFENLNAHVRSRMNYLLSIITQYTQLYFNKADTPPPFTYLFNKIRSYNDFLNYANYLFNYFIEWWKRCTIIKPEITTYAHIIVLFLLKNIIILVAIDNLFFKLLYLTISTTALTVWVRLIVYDESYKAAIAWIIDLIKDSGTFIKIIPVLFIIKYAFITSIVGLISYFIYSLFAVPIVLYCFILKAQIPADSVRKLRKRGNMFADIYLIDELLKPIAFIVADFSIVTLPFILHRTIDFLKFFILYLANCLHMAYKRIILELIWLVKLLRMDLKLAFTPFMTDKPISFKLNLKTAAFFVYVLMLITLIFSLISYTHDQTTYQKLYRDTVRTIAAIGEYNCFETHETKQLLEKNFRHWSSSAENSLITQYVFNTSWYTSLIGRSGIFTGYDTHIHPIRGYKRETCGTPVAFTKHRSTKYWKWGPLTRTYINDYPYGWVRRKKATSLKMKAMYQFKRPMAYHNNNTLFGIIVHNLSAVETTSKRGVLAGRPHAPALLTHKLFVLSVLFFVIPWNIVLYPLFNGYRTWCSVISEFRIQFVYICTILLVHILTFILVYKYYFSDLTTDLFYSTDWHVDYLTINFHMPYDVFRYFMEWIPGTSHGRTWHYYPKLNMALPRQYFAHIGNSFNLLAYLVFILKLQIIYSLLLVAIKRYSAKTIYMKVNRTYFDYQTNPYILADSIVRFTDRFFKYILTTHLYKLLSFMYNVEPFLRRIASTNWFIIYYCILAVPKNLRLAWNFYQLRILSIFKEFPNFLLNTPYDIDLPVRKLNRTDWLYKVFYFLFDTPLRCITVPIMLYYSAAVVVNYGFNLESAAQDFYALKYDPLEVLSLGFRSIGDIQESPEEDYLESNPWLTDITPEINHVKVKAVHFVAKSPEPIDNVLLRGTSLFGKSTLHTNLVYIFCSWVIISTLFPTHWLNLAIRGTRGLEMYNEGFRVTSKDDLFTRFLFWPFIWNSIIYVIAVFTLFFAYNNNIFGFSEISFVAFFYNYGVDNNEMYHLLVSGINYPLFIGFGFYTRYLIALLSQWVLAYLINYKWKLARRARATSADWSTSYHELIDENETRLWILTKKLVYVSILPFVLPLIIIGKVVGWVSTFIYEKNFRELVLLSMYSPSRPILNPFNPSSLGILFRKIWLNNTYLFILFIIFMLYCWTALYLCDNVIAILQTWNMYKPKILLPLAGAAYDSGSIYLGFSNYGIGFAIDRVDFYRHLITLHWYYIILTAFIPVPFIRVIMSRASHTPDDNNLFISGYYYIKTIGILCFDIFLWWLLYIEFSTTSILYDDLDVAQEWWTVVRVNNVWTSDFKTRLYTWYGGKNMAFVGHTPDSASIFFDNWRYNFRRTSKFGWWLRWFGWKYDDYRLSNYFTIVDYLKPLPALVFILITRIPFMLFTLYVVHRAFMYKIKWDYLFNNNEIIRFSYPDDKWYNVYLHKKIYDNSGDWEKLSVEIRKESAKEEIEEREKGSSKNTFTLEHNPMLQDEDFADPEAIEEHENLRQTERSAKEFTFIYSTFYNKEYINIIDHLRKIEWEKKIPYVHFALLPINILIFLCNNLYVRYINYWLLLMHEIDLQQRSLRFLIHRFFYPHCTYIDNKKEWVTKEVMGAYLYLENSKNLYKLLKLDEDIIDSDGTVLYKKPIKSAREDLWAIFYATEEGRNIANASRGENSEYNETVMLEPNILNDDHDYVYKNKENWQEYKDFEVKENDESDDYVPEDELYDPEDRVRWSQLLDKKYIYVANDDTSIGQKTTINEYEEVTLFVDHTVTVNYFRALLECPEIVTPDTLKSLNVKSTLELIDIYRHMPVEYIPVHLRMPSVEHNDYFTSLFLWLDLQITLRDKAMSKILENQPPLSISTTILIEEIKSTFYKFIKFIKNIFKNKN